MIKCIVIEHQVGEKLEPPQFNFKLSCSQDLDLSRKILNEVFCLSSPHVAELNHAFINST